jgi:hypothetical protein
VQISINITESLPGLEIQSANTTLSFSTVKNTHKQCLMERPDIEAEQMV